MTKKVEQKFLLIQRCICEGGEDHFENLAEFLGEEILDPLGSKLFEQYKNTKNLVETGNNLTEKV